jgi:hypothetical protein
MLPNATTIKGFEGGQVHFEDYVSSDVRNFFYSSSVLVSLLLFGLGAPPPTPKPPQKKLRTES